MTAALEGGEWSAARPGRTLPPGKTRYPFYTSLGGSQGGKSRPKKDFYAPLFPQKFQTVINVFELNIPGQ